MAPKNLNNIHSYFTNMVFMQTSRFVQHEKINKQPIFYSAW